jgi:UDP-3-O-[3-hydroxymyristoyl] N-acetylglucosamine deacetylase
MSKPPRQTTVGKAVEAEGVTLHTGERVRMRLCPAEADTGIVFIRTDLSSDGANAPAIAARPEAVDFDALQRRTELVGEAGARVATTEHLLAACMGLGLDNVRVELDGPEVPIFDGSGAPFVALLDRAGLDKLKAPRRVWNLKKPVSLIEEGREVIATPARTMQLGFFCELGWAGIANQAAELSLDDAKAFRDLARARTWVAYEDVTRLRSAGLIRGGALDNAIVLRDGLPVSGNPDGTPGDYRLPNELACHKLLDLLGDLALLGRPVGALVTARGSGHAMHQKFIRLLGKELEE